MEPFIERLIERLRTDHVKDTKNTKCPLQLVRTQNIPISTSPELKLRESAPEYAIYFQTTNEIVIPQITITSKRDNINLHAFSASICKVRKDQVEFLRDLGITYCNPAYFSDVADKIWDAYGSLLSCYQNYISIVLRVCLCTPDSDALKYIEGIEMCKFFGFLRHDIIRRSAPIDISIDSFTKENIVGQIPKELLEKKR